MTDSAVKRPPLLVGACFYLGMLAAIMAVRAVTVVSSWNGEDRASEFSSTLTALRDAGLSASGAESAYRTFLTVIAVLAASGVVFAVYTARGDRVSRVGMTVVIGVSGFMTFTGLLGGTFFFAMVGALAVAFLIRLWTGEIRTYFRALAGHAPAAATPEVTPADPFADPYRHQAASGSGSQTAVQEPVTQPPPGYQQPWPAQAPPRREPLPTSVSIAVWTTLVGSITAVGIGAMVLLLIYGLGYNYDMAKDLDVPMLPGSESEFDQRLRLAVAIGSVSAVLGIGGLVAAIRVLLTRRSGDVTLFVMCVVTIIFSGLMFPFGLPWTAAAIVALVQLRRPESRRWFVKT